MASLACALTPLLDGLERCLCFILLLVMAFGFVVSLEPLASLFAVGAFSFILPRRLVALVAAGSILRRAPGVRGGVRGGLTAPAGRGLPPKARGAGEFRTAHSAHAALHCAARRVSLRVLLLV